MAALLALLSAVTWGVSDFAGGLASRRAGVLPVVLLTTPLGAVGLALLTPLAGGSPDPRALGIGAVAGVIGSLGLVLLYAGLAVGPMGIVAPLTAVCSGVVPVLAGVAAGERPTGPAYAGIVLALVAIVLVSREPEAAAAGTAVSARGVLLALLSGACFGTFFVLLDRAGDGSGLWPLLSGRVCASAAVLAVAVGLRRLALPPRQVLGLACVPGVLDVVANVCFLLATRRGLLALVAVLAALYPAATVLLASAVLGERYSRLQATGLGLAGVSVVLIAATG